MLPSILASFLAILLADEEIRTETAPVQYRPLQMSGGGSPSVPIGDPIGDALRAAAVAYWKLDEASGTRIDSTASGYDLVECADGDPNTPAPNPPVGSVAGKIGNAVKIFDSTVSISTIANNTASISIAGDAITIAGWLKVNALTGGNAIVSNNQSFDQVILQTSVYDAMRCAVVAARQDNSMYVLPYFASEVSALAENAGNLPFDIVADTWYFVTMDFYFAAKQIQWSVNGVAQATFNITAWNALIDNSPFTLIQFSSTNYISDTDYMISDEIGIYLTHFVQADVDYLYNSGAGRTLYP